MRCPICRKSATWEGNPFRPFCSERCKLIDLDNWLAERYRISPPVETGEKNASAENPVPDTEGDRD
jgi:endogenous inhibitor of DNA gyrase (YacG/DUF329 family)